MKRARPNRSAYASAASEYVPDVKWISPISGLRASATRSSSAWMCVTGTPKLTWAVAEAAVIMLAVREPA